MVQEKRNYSRISTRIKARLRRVESPEAPPLFHAGRLNIPQSLPDGQSNLREANLPEGLGAYLESLERKIDLILSLLSRDSLKNDFPLETEVTELSGGGLRCFAPDEGLSVGQAIEMVIFLSQLPMSVAGVVGVVRRIEQVEGQTVYGVEFTNLRESDREKIVHFVFQEQREQIRTQKND